MVRGVIIYPCFWTYLSYQSDGCVAYELLLFSAYRERFHTGGYRAESCSQYVEVWRRFVNALATAARLPGCLCPCVVCVCVWRIFLPVIVVYVCRSCMSVSRVLVCAPALCIRPVCVACACTLRPCLAFVSHDVPRVRAPCVGSSVLCVPADLCACISRRVLQGAGSSGDESNEDGGATAGSAFDIRGPGPAGGGFSLSRVAEGKLHVHADHRTRTSPTLSRCPQSGRKYHVNVRRARYGKS